MMPAVKWRITLRVAKLGVRNVARKQPPRMASVVAAMATPTKSAEGREDREGKGLEAVRRVVAPLIPRYSLSLTLAGVIAAATRGASGARALQRLARLGNQPVEEG